MSDKIEPAVFPTVEKLETEEGLQYVRVDFSGLNAPYSADGRYFTRVGTSNKALSASEPGAIVIRRERSRSPWDSLPSGRPVSDADEQAVREFVELGLQAGRVSGGSQALPTPSRGSTWWLPTARSRTRPRWRSARRRARTPG